MPSENFTIIQDLLVDMGHAVNKQLAQRYLNHPVETIVELCEELSMDYSGIPEVLDFLDELVDECEISLKDYSYNRETVIAEATQQLTEREGKEETEKEPRTRDYTRSRSRSPETSLTSFTTPPFRELFKKLLREKYGDNISALLEDNKLTGRLTKDIMELARGIPPSPDLAYCLGYSFTDSGVERDMWNRAAIYAIGASSAARQVGFRDGEFVNVRTERLEEFLNTLDSMHALAAMLRFIRIVSGNRQEDLAKDYGLRFCREYESHEKSRNPSYIDLKKYMDIFEDFSEKEAFLIRNASVNIILDTAQKDIHGAGGTGWKHVAQLLLDDENPPNPIVAPSKASPYQEDCYLRLRQLIRDGIVPHYEEEGVPNPWPGILKNLPTRIADRPTRQSGEALKIYDQKARETGTSDVYYQTWHRWKSGITRPNAEQQKIILEAFAPYGVTFQEGMSESLRPPSVILNESAAHPQQIRRGIPE